MTATSVRAKTQRSPLGRFVVWLPRGHGQEIRCCSSNEIVQLIAAPLAGGCITASRMKFNYISRPSPAPESLRGSSQLPGCACWELARRSEDGCSAGQLAVCRSPPIKLNVLTAEVRSGPLGRCLLYRRKDGSRTEVGAHLE